MAKSIREMNLKEICEAIGAKLTNEQLNMLQTYINLKYTKKIKQEMKYFVKNTVFVEKPSCNVYTAMI